MKKKNENKLITQEQAIQDLKNGYKKAEQILKEDKLEELLRRLEEKLKTIPKIGEKLSHIPVFISLLKSYIKKEYTKIPIGTLTAIISALLYVICPFDLLPDFIPIIGHTDDAAVALACYNLVETDIQEYLQWRDETTRH